MDRKTVKKSGESFGYMLGFIARVAIGVSVAIYVARLAGVQI